MKSTKMTTTSSNFSDEQLREALFALEELMEKCVCQFFLLGDLANNIRLSPSAFLSGEKIYIAVRANEWRTAKPLRDILLPDEKNVGDRLDLVINKVPVHMILVDEKDGLLLILNPPYP